MQRLTRIQPSTSFLHSAPRYPEQGARTGMHVVTARPNRHISRGSANPRWAPVPITIFACRYWTTFPGICCC